MTSYHHFIGIDIGKYTFTVVLHPHKTSQDYTHDAHGIAAFIADYAALLPQALCVLETTGGYELELLYTLCQQGYPVHRADTRKVKSFIRSFGTAAKTDALDARALACYAYERQALLPRFTPASPVMLRLFALVQRRADLKKMLIAEKNRQQAPTIEPVRSSCQHLIAVLEHELHAITQLIDTLIAQDPLLAAKRDLLKTIPGVGDRVAFELLILLPELGSIDHKKIASLAGLAPRAKDSGTLHAYRRTGYGRGGIKPILFMAAMAARNTRHSSLRAFYDRLIAKGKKKMVALTALMRKILIIANAKLKSLHPLIT